MRFVSMVLLILSNTSAFTGGDVQKISLAEVANNAVEQSKLTLPGSAAFHLKATITEATNPDSDYKAEIEGTGCPTRSGDAQSDLHILSRL